MSRITVALVGCLLFAAATAKAQAPPPRIVDLKAADGVLLKATYFSAGRPAPGVILFHQGNRTRESWTSVAAQLAGSGINVLTVDSRAHGDSGGKLEESRKQRQGDL